MAISFFGLIIVAVLSVALLYGVAKAVSVMLSLTESLRTGHATLACPHCGQQTTHGRGRCDVCGQEL